MRLSDSNVDVDEKMAFVVAIELIDLTWNQRLETERSSFASQHLPCQRVFSARVIFQLGSRDAAIDCSLNFLIRASHQIA
jgi:hypothetical protein